MIQIWLYFSSAPARIQSRSNIQSTRDIIRLQTSKMVALHGELSGVPIKTSYKLNPTYHALGWFWQKGKTEQTPLGSFYLNGILLED